MFLCSNVHLSYADSQGSISRRLAIFKFDKYVAHKDVTLEARISESELPAILAKCLRAYGAMVDAIGSQSFWEVCPAYFHENTREMSEQTDSERFTDHAYISANDNADSQFFYR